MLSQAISFQGNFLHIPEGLFNTSFLFGYAFFFSGNISEFRNILEGLPNAPILLTVIQNRGRIVSTSGIIKKIP